MPRVPPAPSVALRAARALGDRRARPRLDWLARLLDAPLKSVAAPLRELEPLLPLEEWTRQAHRAAGRSFYAQFRAPLDLYALTRLLKPRHIVETGVSSGISSMHLLLGLRANGSGSLHSIDLPTRQRGPTLQPDESVVSLPPGRSTGWAIPPKLTRGWDIRLGPSQTVLPELVRSLPRVDLFLHDSLHTPAHLTFELETVLPKLAPGAVVLADNTIWTGAAFPKFARRLGVPVVRRGRTDLVGLRLPVARPASAPERGTTRRRAPRRRSSR